MTLVRENPLSVGMVSFIFGVWHHTTQWHVPPGLFTILLPSGQVLHTVLYSMLNVGSSPPFYPLYFILYTFLPPLHFYLPVENKNSSLLSAKFLLLAFLVLTIDFLTMPRTLSGSDASVVRLEAQTLLNTGSIAIPPATANYGDKGQYFHLNESTGKWYSKYGFLNTALFAIPLAIGKVLRVGLGLKFINLELLFNIFNITCALVTAACLYKFASLYAESFLVKSVFIFSVFYCTFWWNHMRIQSFEAFQPVILIAATYHFILACHEITAGPPGDRGKNLRYRLFLAGLLLGLLWLSKALYLLVAPLFTVLLVIFQWPHFLVDGKFNPARAWERLRPVVIWFGLPLLLCFIALLAINDFKFGSPFDTGYTQWKKEHHLFSGNLLSSLTGFLFDPQFSIFLDFPVLLVALAGFPAFFRKHRKDAVVIYSLAVLLLLMNSKFVNWRGLWSYGPRYMLPVLAMMSLPFLLVLVRMVENYRNPRSLLTLLAIAGLLGYSALLQWNVNSVGFNAYFQIKETFIDQIGDEQLDTYFSSTPFGIICGDLLAHKHGKPLWFRERIAQITHDPATLARLDQYIAVCSASNYYLFPDPAPRSSEVHK